MSTVVKNEKLKSNIIVTLILVVVIFLGVSFLSPCFQKKFLNNKNLYQYIKGSTYVST